MIMMQRTVFAVDDEPAVLATVQRVLEHEGYAVRVFSTANCAAAAVKQAEAQGRPVDLVLLDMMLGQPSPEAAETLLAWLAGRTPPVETIVMSGHLGGSALAGLMLKGAADFITKPFSRERLLRVVNRHLGAGSHHAARERGHGNRIDLAQLESDAIVIYAPANRLLGIGLARLVEGAGVSVWCADLDLPPDAVRPEHIRAAALQRSRACLIVVTPESLSSEPFMAEVRAACEHQQRQGDHYFLAALGWGVPPARLPKMLRDIEWREFSNTTRLADNLQSLKNTIRLFLGRALV